MLVELISKGYFKVEAAIVLSLFCILPLKFINSLVAHRVFIATQKVASVKVVLSISVLDESRNLLCSSQRQMESETSKKVELAAFMLAAWAHPLKKRLPVKEAMLNAGF